MQALMFKFIASLLLLTLGTVGCAQPEDPQVEMISPADMTKHEEALLSSLFDWHFVYDLQLDDENDHQLHVWIEHYIRGEKQEPILAGDWHDTEATENDRLAFTITHLNGIEEQLWQLVFPPASTRKEVVLPDMDQGGFTSWKAAPQSDIQRGIPLMLAIGAAGTGTMQGGDPQALTGDEDALAPWKENQHLFLLYIQVD